MPSRHAQPIPSVLEIYPRLRRRARRAAIVIRRLVETLIVAFPDSALLVRDRGAAEQMDTTPYDYVVADLIAAARPLCDAIAALDDPL